MTSAVVAESIASARSRTYRWLRPGCIVGPRLAACGQKPGATRHHAMADSIHVSAGILLRNGLILACQRGPQSSHAGKWEFPGGKVEVGESGTDCLRRELEEELGIAATVGVELWRTVHQYPGRPLIAVTFFRVDAFRGEPTNRVFGDIRWVKLSELASLDFLEADRDLIERLPELLARTPTPTPIKGGAPS